MAAVWNRAGGDHGEKPGPLAGGAPRRPGSRPVRRPPVPEGAAGEPAADPALENRLGRAARAGLRPALAADEPMAPPPTLLIQSRGQRRLASALTGPVQARSGTDILT